MRQLSSPRTLAGRMEPGHTHMFGLSPLPPSSHLYHAEAASMSAAIKPVQIMSNLRELHVIKSFATLRERHLLARLRAVVVMYNPITSRRCYQARQLMSEATIPTLSRNKKRPLAAVKFTPMQVSTMQTKPTMKPSAPA